MFLQFNIVLCNASYYINRVVIKENEWGDNRGVIAIMSFVACELGKGFCEFFPGPPIPTWERLHLISLYFLLGLSGEDEKQLKCYLHKIKEIIE